MQRRYVVLVRSIQTVLYFFTSDLGLTPSGFINFEVLPFRVSISNCSSQCRSSTSSVSHIEIPSSSEISRCLPSMSHWMCFGCSLIQADILMHISGSLGFRLKVTSADESSSVTCSAICPNESALNEWIKVRVFVSDFFDQFIRIPPFPPPNNDLYSVSTHGLDFMCVTR
jgi:hypothetical protein